MVEIYKTCIGCGAKFRAKNNVQKYCSHKCLDKATADKRREAKRGYKAYKSSSHEKRGQNKGCDIGYYKKCENCGKEFLCLPEWAYKRYVKNYTMFFCSWSCLRAKTKADEDKEREKLMKDYEY